MTGSSKRHGRHRLEKQASKTVTYKRVLSATTAALAVTGALQIANATASSAAVNPWHYYLQPSGTKQAPVIYYSFYNGVDSTTQRVINQSVSIWNSKLGGNGLLRPAGPGQNATLVFGRQNLGYNGPGKILGVARPNQCDWGGACRVADIMLDPSWFDGRPAANNSPAFIRQLNVTVHEIGHVLGLYHSTGGPDSRNPGNYDEIMRPLATGNLWEPSAQETSTVRQRYYPGAPQPDNRGSRPVPTGKPQQPQQPEYKQTQFYVQGQDNSWHSLTAGSSTQGYTNFVGYGLDKNGVWQEIQDPRNYLRNAEQQRAKSEAQSTDHPKADQQRAEQQKADQQKADQQKAEQQKADQQKAEQQKADQQKADQQKAEQERADQQRAERERADQQKAEQERADQQRAERERADQQKADQERADQQRAERERADQQKADQERADQQRAERERADQQRRAEQR
ncbi:hypothetical protein [Streptomyces sp. AK02-04a]|uniref:hypothetical protein n=1 Tax=Streptomyces sp. AK02-04a TaxID=3028649 RepID=UPI0029A5B848|nr:hypothetical protein [Streptomyces sp. AK02-04a]MDX3763652.1 hypothetical protein [Streptomyces sp. AK02-04a]